MLLGEQNLEFPQTAEIANQKAAVEERIMLVLVEFRKVMRGDSRG